MRLIVVAPPHYLSPFHFSSQVNEHQKMADRVEKMAIVLQELIDGGVNVVSLDLATRRFVSQGPLHTISSSKKIKEGYPLPLLLFFFLFLSSLFCRFVCCTTIH